MRPVARLPTQELRMAPRSTIEVGALAIIALSVAALVFVLFSVR